MMTKPAVLEMDAVGTDSHVDGDINKASALESELIRWCMQCLTALRASNMKNTFLSSL